MDQFKNNYYHDYSSQLLHKKGEEENQLRFKNIIENDFSLALINENPAKLKFYLNKIDIFDTINKLDLELVKYAPASIVIDYLANSKIFSEVKKSNNYFNFLDNFIKTTFIYDRDDLLDYFLKEPSFDYYLQSNLLNYSFIFNSSKILKKVLNKFPDKLLELTNNIDWYLLIFIKPFIDCSDNHAFKDKKYTFDQFIENKPIKEIINDLEKMRPTQFLQTLIDIFGYSTLQDSAYASYNYLSYTSYYDGYNNISSCRSSLVIFHVLNILDLNISPSDYFNQNKVFLKTGPANLSRFIKIIILNLIKNCTRL